MSYCYFKGEIIEESKASISIHNLGLQRGFGIFDLFRGRNGKPTFLDDHLERFHNSQKFLALESLISKDEIQNAVYELQNKNGYERSSFRLMLLGDGEDTDEVFKPLFYIVNRDLTGFKNPQSASLIAYEYVREYPEIKTLNYLTSNHLHRKKIANQSVDVLFHKNGFVSEASRSNIFIVKDGVIITPKKNILKGITRKHLIEISKSYYEVSEADIQMQDMYDADEVFLTSTLKEVLPITAIQDQSIPTGEITKKLGRLFHEYVAS